MAGWSRREKLLSAVAVGALVSLSIAGQARALRPYKASCINRSFTAFVLRSQPVKCIIASSPNAPLARAANLSELRWRAWGTGRAVATGYELGFHLPLAHIRAVVVLTRPAFVEELGIYVYKHFRVTTKFGTLSGAVSAG